MHDACMALFAILAARLIEASWLAFVDKDAPDAGGSALCDKLSAIWSIFNGCYCRRVTAFFPNKCHIQRLDTHRALGII